ncbi:dolichol-P-mannose synthesis [Ascosphaera pollenicola]|nr:dolichol-P-mannose synthesis [Ascosphaera pollenicola]
MVMADIHAIPSPLPLTSAAVREAHALIKPYIHRTPLLTNRTLNKLASSTQGGSHSPAAAPRINFFFKCENYQPIGAFKARGAFHAVLRLIERLGIEEVKRRGVTTHSSGNHAQALALVAQTLDIPAYIVMPHISTPSKIAGTKSYGAEVIFSGSTSEEREAVVEKIIADRGAILVPPYDHNDIILQGTTALELEEQYRNAVTKTPELSAHTPSQATLDAVITPIGGGGLNSGVATFFSDSPATLVFGAEPSFQGADDCCRGLRSTPPTRIPSVSTLTIGDGLRTPVGVISWSIISDPSKHAGAFAVSEDEIKKAMRLVIERMKVVVEPSAVVGLAVCLFNEEFRQLIAGKQREARDRGELGENEGWDIGIVLSGGNATVDTIAQLFAPKNEH